MSSGPYYAVITAAHTSLSGRPDEPRRIFRAGDGIQLNMVHQLIAWGVPLPPEPLHYRAIAILQNFGQTGFFQRTDGEVIYQTERGVYWEGAYENMDSMITWLDLGAVPADPAATYEAAFWAARSRDNTRRAVVQEIVNGANTVEFTPGLWSYQAILVLLDPTATTPLTGTLDFREWEPWYYIVRP